MSEKFMEWLMDNRIPSISPNVGMHLAEITKEIMKKSLLVEDKELKDEIDKYIEALKYVMNISAKHQGEVIATLERYIVASIV